MPKFTRDDVDKFFDYGIDIAHRTIYMGSAAVEADDESGVDAIMAERVIKALHILDQKSEPITIIMNNPGGDWYHGMGIYDAIKSCQSEVTVKVFGMAMSMGAMILQAADHRQVAPNARIMIHYGYMSWSGDSKKFQKWSDECKRTDEEALDILLAKVHEKHPTFKREQLHEMLRDDTILTAIEAVNLGLADDVL